MARSMPHNARRWYRIRHPGRRLVNGWSLRARLIAALVGLLALVSVVVGVLSTLALRDFLVGQLDSQLQAAGDRTSRAYDQPPPEREHNDGDEPGPDFLDAPGQAAGTLGARLRPDHTIEAGVLDETGVRQQVPIAAVSVLAGLPADGEPHTRDVGRSVHIGSSSSPHRTATPPSPGCRCQG